jgi:hypothetical protein
VRSNNLDSLDSYLERRGGVDDGLSIEAEELLATATTCPDCGGEIGSAWTCRFCKMDWSNYSEIEQARKKLDDMGISYE